MRRSPTVRAWLGALAFATLACSSSVAKAGPADASGPPAAAAEAKASAATHGLVIPPAHPRLWFDADRLAQARAWYRKNAFTPAGQNEQLNLDRVTRGLLNADDPKDQRRQCRAAIEWALVTPFPGYSGPLLEALATTRAGRARDGYRYFGEVLILVYDWCHDHLTADERRRYVELMNQWVGWWPGEPYANLPMHQNNYYWAYIRNQIEWAIASWGENPGPLAAFRGGTTTLEGLLDDAIGRRLGPPAAGTRGREGFNALALDARASKGGVLGEGTQYGTYPVGYSVVPFRSAELLGNDLRAGSEQFWREAVYAFIYSTTLVPTPHTPGEAAHARYFPHADMSGEAGYRVAFTPFVGNFMTEAALRWSSAPIGGHARRWLEVTRAPRDHFVRSTDRGGPSRPFTDLPLDYYAPGLRWLYGRSSWEPGATAFFLQMGDRQSGLEYVSHIHGDWGTWQLWRNGQWLSRETAGYGQTASQAIANHPLVPDASTPVRYGAPVFLDLPVAHNSLLVNGRGTMRCLLPRAPPGPSYAQECLGAPQNTIISATGQVTVPRLESTPEYAYAVADLGGVLRPASVPEFVSWVREFVFVRHLETLVILDRVQSRDAGDVKTFLAHCTTSPALSTAAATGLRTATCTAGSQALVLTTLVPSDPAHRVVAEGGPAGQYRIEVDATSREARTHIVTVLQAKDRGAPALSPSVREDARTYTVTLDGSTRLVLEKGMGSAGGAITVGGRTRGLRAGVQPMNVTEAGPAWE